MSKAITSSMAWISEGQTKSSEKSKSALRRNIRILQPLGFTEKHVKDIYNCFKKLDTRNVGKVQASKLMKDVTYGRVYGLRIFCPIGRGEDEGESSSEESSDGEEDDAQPKIQTKRIACTTVCNIVLTVEYTPATDNTSQPIFCAPSWSTILPFMVECAISLHRTSSG